MSSVALTCHPSSPSRAVRAIAADVRSSPGGVLTFTYSMDADMERVRVPAPRLPGRAAGLWRHTCFEAFVRADGDGYYELNFSPSGEWAVYHFADYRAGMTDVAEAAGPRIACESDAQRLVLTAIVSLADLPRFRSAGAVRLSLAAVVEEHDGELGYWAAAHPHGRPDFHHAAGVALEIGIPR